MASDDAFTFVVNTFKPVSKEKANITLSDMSLVGDNLTFTGTELQLFDEYGAAVVRAYYANEKYAARKSIAVGWYDADVFDEDDEYESIGTTTVPYGTGMAIVCGDDDTSIAFSGEVMKGEQNIAVASDDAFTFTGNCVPVEGKQLKDFSLSGDNLTFTGTELQLFDEYGAATTRAYYANEKYAARKSIAVGWYDADVFDEDDEYEAIGTTAIPAAQGLAIVCGDDDTEFVVPQALAE